MSLHPPTKPRSRTISPRPPPLDIPCSPPVESPLASGSGFRVPREQSTSNTPSTSNTNTDSILSSSTYTDTDTETDIDSAHPFANSTAKLEVLKNGGEIDVEEESRLYDEIYGTWDGDDDVLPPSPTFLPQGTSSASIFSKDIYLADNTGNSSGAFARDVRITGWSQVGELDSRKSPRLGSMSSGAYVVYDIKITTKSNTTIHLLKRYTDFSRLHTTLLRTLPPSLHPHVPALPPKAPLARFRPVFLDRRRRMLQFWLACVLLHPEVGGCECVRGWVVG